MTRTLPEAFDVRPHTPDGVWLTNDARYRSYAHELLAQHERICSEILLCWPTDPPAPIRDMARYPEIARLGRMRDLTSDTTRVYAAMAVEGYVNFYGVVRLGQETFDGAFERQGLVPKLRAVLMNCDDLVLQEDHPLIQVLSTVAKDRNALVHPKAKEIHDMGVDYLSGPLPMPETARSAVANMEAFFAAFVAALPAAAAYLDRGGYEPLHS